MTAFPSDRHAILKELEPKLLELSKSPYGHFVVGKLISLAPKEEIPGMQAMLLCNCYTVLNGHRTCFLPT